MTTNEVSADTDDMPRKYFQICSKLLEQCEETAQLLLGCEAPHERAIPAMNDFFFKVANATWAILAKDETPQRSQQRSVQPTQTSSGATESPSQEANRLITLPFNNQPSTDANSVQNDVWSGFRRVASMQQSNEVPAANEASTSIAITPKRRGRRKQDLPRKAKATSSTAIQFKCNMCHKKYSHTSSLNSHIKRTHGDPGDPPKIKSPSKRHEPKRMPLRAMKRHRSASSNGAAITSSRVSPPQMNDTPHCSSITELNEPYLISPPNNAPFYFMKQSANSEVESHSGGQARGTDADATESD